ncbi:MAG: DUF551 domain-containing protein [Paludibacteraceae bacterium]|nr:DUF551 domain-containing protein [Paludibacteraceae bacterium]
METKMIKTFEEKKEHAELMRNIFGITVVLYIGFIIWIVCIHRYEILWWAFNVWLLLVCIAVKNQGEKVDAELVLKYLEYIDSRDELIDAICKNHPLISVNDKLPEEDPDDKGYSVEVIGLFQDGRVSKCFCSINEDIWFIEGLTCDKPTHWMPIPKV